MNVQGNIESPPRTKLFGTSLILICVIVLSVVPFLRPKIHEIALVPLLIAGCALFVRNPQPLHLALFTLFLTGVPALHPHLGRWPFKLLVPVLLYLLVVFAVPRLRMSLVWVKAGFLDRRSLVLMAGTAALSTVGLYLWVLLTAPDLSHHLKNIPDMPAWLLPLAGLGFSLGNAFIEEFVYRGIVMQALDAAFGPRTLSVVAQAWLFGTLHFQKGFPNGWFGLLLAGIYGLMLGGLRRRTGGMASPFLTHVAADMIIFAILAARILFG